MSWVRRDSLGEEEGLVERENHYFNYLIIYLLLLLLFWVVTHRSHKSFAIFFIRVSHWRPLYFLVFPLSTKTQILSSSLFFVFYTRHPTPLKL